MSEIINLAGIVRESITDGPGIRFSVFCQGCTHCCEGCHNEQTWPIGQGNDVTVDKLMEEINKNPLINGVTFTGGEPFLQPKGFRQLGERIKDTTELNIMACSGFTYEDLVAMKDNDVNHLLDVLDYLVDGRFEEDKRDLTLKFRGSTNQRIIDMNKTRKKGKLMLANEYMI